MEYILSAMLLHNSVSRPSQISDKGDMGPTVDYRIFPGIFSSWNQNKLFRVENTPRQSYRQYCILSSRRTYLAMIALEI